MTKSGKKSNFSTPEEAIVFGNKPNHFENEIEVLRGEKERRYNARLQDKLGRMSDSEISYFATINDDPTEKTAFRQEQQKRSDTKTLSGADEETLKALLQAVRSC